MNSGICICVLLAALSSSCLARPQYSPLQDEEQPRPVAPNAALAEQLLRPARSMSITELKPFLQVEADGDPSVSLNELLSRLMARKGTIRRNSTLNSSRATGLSPNHRIKDRDYLGWMDFGRRSAEEYEYTS